MMPVTMFLIIKNCRVQFTCSVCKNGFGKIYQEMFLRNDKNYKSDKKKDVKNILKDYISTSDHLF
mgnify:CR=1 FL=1